MHNSQFRVYYEDTDLAGIVYHANFLKFIERGRSDMVAEMGVDQTALKAEQDIVFAVRRMQLEFIRPAKFGDLLEVTSFIGPVQGAQFDMSQQVSCEGHVLFDAELTLVGLHSDGRPARLPQSLRDILNSAQD